MTKPLIGLKRMKSARDSARQILSEVRSRGGNPETDSAIELSPEIATAYLDLLRMYAEVMGMVDPMNGLKYDNMWEEES